MPRDEKMTTKTVTTARVVTNTTTGVGTGNERITSKELVYALPDGWTEEGLRQLLRSHGFVRQDNDQDDLLA